VLLLDGEEHAGSVRTQGFSEEQMQTDAITISNVRKSFDSLVAVNDVSLTVRQGEVFGLLGPNGAGKTTLIRMIMDIIRPDSGTIAVFGHPLSDEDKRRIGYLPEERGLYARQKVLSVLEYFAELKGLERQRARQSAHDWLQRFEMTDIKNKKVSELSKGNQQKIQLIAALVADPQIVVLDEPFSGLDPVNRRAVSDLIRELSAAGKTVLLSAHQMDVVETLCQRVFMINQGKRVLYGDLDAIRREHSDRAVLVKADADYSQCGLVARSALHNGVVKVHLRDGANPRDLLAWLVETGAEVESFERAITPLEEIFIKVVQME
jgi:ABC-2 type transport system ATP-binding protein